VVEIVDPNPFGSLSREKLDEFERQIKPHYQKTTRTSYFNTMAVILSLLSFGLSQKKMVVQYSSSMAFTMIQRIFQLKLMQARKDMEFHHQLIPIGDDGVGRFYLPGTFCCLFWRNLFPRP